MLNPSKADGLKDDPTVRRCMALAREWGYGGLVVANLFAYRSPNRGILKTVADPVGPENDATLISLRDDQTFTVCAWGTYGYLSQRDEAVYALLTSCNRPVHYLTLTRDGYPGHPLRLPSGIQPKPWLNPTFAVI